MKKAASGMGGGGAGKGAKEPLEGWSMILTKTIEATEGSGILQMWQSGIDMTAEGGVKIFSLEQGYNSLYGGINIQAGRIDLVVDGEGSSARIKVEAIAEDFNGSQVYIEADRITLNGNTTTQGMTVADAMSVTSSNGVIINKDLTLALGMLSNGTITSEAGFVAESSNVRAEQYVIAESGFKTSSTGNTATWQDQYVITSVSASYTPSVKLEKVAGGNWDGTVVSSVGKSGTTIYYLGHT